MKKSAAIYRLWTAGRIYENNQARSRLMAANFLECYRAAGEPKTILRMGAIHVGLGTTPLATVDLGTLTSEIAAAHGKTALRILFLPAGGRHLVFGGSAKTPFKTQPYDDEDTKGFLSDIALNPSDLTAGTWSLVPLAPVRNALGLGGIAKLAPMSRYMLLGFDYLVTSPDAKPATLLAP